MKEFEYIYAFDPVIRRRVPHVVRTRYKKKIAISLVSGHQFNLKKGR